MQEIATSFKSLDDFREKNSDLVVAVEEFRGDVCLHINSNNLLATVSKLRDEFGFQMMMDLFAMDYAQSGQKTPERFAVIYILYNFAERKHLRLKCFLPADKPEIDSLCEEFAMANWFEREAWDLFGIRFRGHPNLTRILCHNEFEGHPLRKDYPANKFQRAKRALPASGI